MPITQSEEYKVQLEVFEGPLDLLLYLINKNEVDIYDIPIESITSQYVQYLSVMRMLDLNIAGEFIVMAATLLMIKSRMLLPVEDRPEMEAEEADPRWDLVRQLIEYKKFKDAATHLQECEFYQGNVFGQGGVALAPTDPEPGIGLGDVSLFDLIAALNEALKRAEKEEFGEIFGEQFTIADKIEAILVLIRSGGQITFSELFSRMANRNEITCTFLALLELIRLRQVKAQQKHQFGEILILKAEESEPAGENASGQ